jgi:hypothetical protein
MFDELHITRFHAHHHVADDDGARRAHAVQAALLDGELEAALGAAAGGDEIVVLRHLQAGFTLQPAHSDLDNARRWGDSLALALQRVLLHAPAHGLLRFARKAQALQAFAGDLLHERTARDWAWQQLGWLPGRAGSAVTPAQRRQVLLRLLADPPDTGVPLLRSLLGTPEWPRLLALLSPSELQGLAASVLLVLAGDPAARFEAPTQVLAEEATFEWSASGLPLAPTPAQARQIARSCATADARLSALRLLTLLLDPPLARRGAAAVDERLQVCGLLRQSAAPRSHAAPGPEATSAVQPGAPGPTPPVPRLPEAAAPPHTAQEIETRTAFGGLMLLAPLLPESGALALLEDQALWSGASLAFTLHRLALQLHPMATHDPAALAFCGQAPGSEPPQPRQSLTAAQRQALALAVDALQQHLAERLPDGPAATRLQRLLLRPARIAADPGWIDVHFSLRDVSVELRRAALDLDPGFLPWLGLVLRYRYE